GEFTDLCRGPHVSNTKELDSVAFKLTRVSGAYWRGDETRQQMQRVYGVAFLSQKDLDQYFRNLEEAEKRDHRKLGRELDLFTFSDLVGPGLPLYTPRGTIIRQELQRALNEMSQKYGMQAVSIPHLAKLELYKISGHAEKFDDELFRVKSHYNQEFVLKPVNCPHHTQIYAAKPRSYRDLPLRLMESTMQYRDEKPGEIGGLTRTRGFTVDDGHIFCRVDQIKQEAVNIVHSIREFYSSLDMWGNHWVSLSLRDPKTPEKYIGDPADWASAEAVLSEISAEQKLNAQPMEGEAALYGPKLDFMFKDALGNERQLATIQLDFAMPKRFDLTYTDSDGQSKNPVMIHRAILGSYERFLAILIEHYAGAFPVWLAPEQVRVIPISEKQAEYAEKITTELYENSIRFELDASGQSLGKRIREAELAKVPYILILGEKEVESTTVTVRHYQNGDQGAVKLADFLAELNTAIFERKN
ncbi:MAG TPA: threonine--tRNA ligase, partial [Gammaproteobacteria bacterium]|nr:threonine--tRNA ligase [Gammaproteobacteria bacterium]